MQGGPLLEGYTFRATTANRGDNLPFSLYWRRAEGEAGAESTHRKAWLRCPWHGFDYDPISGRPPGGFSDAVTSYEVDERADGVYVRLPELPAPTRTVADVLVETLVAYGVTHVFGMVGHSNLGFADALRRAEERGELTYVGIRHEGAAAFAASAYGKLTGRPAACFAIAGPGSRPGIRHRVGWDDRRVAVARRPLRDNRGAGGERASREEISGL